MPPAHAQHLPEGQASGLHPQPVTPVASADLSTLAATGARPAAEPAQLQAPVDTRGARTAGAAAADVYVDAPEPSGAA